MKIRDAQRAQRDVRKLRDLTIKKVVTRVAESTTGHDVDIDSIQFNDGTELHFHVQEGESGDGYLVVGHVRVKPQLCSECKVVRDFHRCGELVERNVSCLHCEVCGGAPVK